RLDEPDQARRPGRLRPDRGVRRGHRAPQRHHRRGLTPALARTRAPDLAVAPLPLGARRRTLPAPRPALDYDGLLRGAAIRPRAGPPPRPAEPEPAPGASFAVPCRQRPRCGALACSALP